MIYGADEENFEIKDSNRNNWYKIPIDRPDFYQVDPCLVTMYNRYEID